MSATPRRACVIGAGLAGLTCALAAARRGLAVRVFDEAARRAPLAAHVDVVPNMLRDLVALGLGEACVMRGFVYRGVDIVGRTGHRVLELETPALAGARYPAALGIGHDALQEILEEAARSHGAVIERGVRVRAIRHDDDVARVELDGVEPAAADLVLLATGGVAELRAAVFPKSERARDAGQRWIYTLIPRPRELDRPLVAMGQPGFRAVMVPIRGDVAGLVLARLHDAAPDLRPDVPWITLREDLRKFAPVVRAAATHIDARSPIVVRPVRSGLLEAPWHRGPVLAVGECAHMLPPHFGQAAAQAIEDARVLDELFAERLERHLLFERFLQRRMPRAQRVQQLASTAAHWDAAPESRADFRRLFEELSSTVATPA